MHHLEGSFYKVITMEEAIRQIVDTTLSNTSNCSLRIHYDQRTYFMDKLLYINLGDRKDQRI